MWYINTDLQHVTAVYCFCRCEGIGETYKSFSPRITHDREQSVMSAGPQELVVPLATANGQHYQSVTDRGKCEGKFGNW